MHKYLSRRCPVLRPLIKRVGPLELPKPTRVVPYHGLMRAIAYQQLHARAAQTILDRFLALYDGKYPTPEQLRATDDATIRATGFSASKILALRDIAAHVEGGVVPDLKAARKLSNEELIARLTQIRGVGRWTVEMLLIFQLGREDVLPLDDFGVLNGYKIATNLDRMPTKKEMAAAGEIWAPYRSLASLYFWRAADMAKPNYAAKPATRPKKAR